MLQHQIKVATRNQAQGDETRSRQEQLGHDQEDDNLRNIVTTRHNRNAVAKWKLRSQHQIKEVVQELCCDISTKVATWLF